jgi:cell division protein FtsQ
MLTPVFWFFVKFALPVGCIALAVSIYFSDESRREAAWSMVADIRRQIEERPEFMVELMAIDGASGDVAEDIRQIIPLDFPVSSFDLDLADIKARAEELDAVAHSDVRIRTGGVLQIDVVERVPAVVWRSEQGLELLDAEGHRVAALTQRGDRPDLLVLAGIGADIAVPEALDVFAVSEPLHDRIRGLTRVGARRWDVVLLGNQRIMLPEADAVTVMERVIALDQAQDLLSKDVVAVDMRKPDRPTLRLSEAADAARRGLTLTQTGADLR